MFRNLIKYFMVPALLGAVAADVSAQTAQLDAVANESSGQYAPMNMGYAGFNSLGMTQAAWLDPLQTSVRDSPARLIPNITGRRIWSCLSACARG